MFDMIYIFILLRVAFHSLHLRMNSLRVFSRVAAVSRRGFAAAAAAKPAHGTDELRLTFASPDKVCVLQCVVMILRVK